MGRKMVVVPRELTAENGAKAALSGEFFVKFEPGCCYCEECEGAQEGEGFCEWCGREMVELTYKVPVPWSTIKAIHRRMIGHFEGRPAIVESQAGFCSWCQSRPCKCSAEAQGSVVGLNAEETGAIERLAAQQELLPDQVVRQAIRLYESVIAGHTKCSPAEPPTGCPDLS